VFGEFGKEFQFDRAQQCFGGPKAKAYLHDLIQPWFFQQGINPPGVFQGPRASTTEKIGPTFNVQEKFTG
jgi:hypothetical protein